MSRQRRSWKTNWRNDASDSEAENSEGAISIPPETAKVNNAGINYNISHQRVISTQNNYEIEEETWRSKRTKSELDQTDQNFKQLLQIIESLQEKIEELETEVAKNNSGGLFGSIIRMIPGGQQVLSAIDAGKSIYKTCSKAWDRNKGFLENVRNSGNAVLQSGLKGFQDFFSK